MGLFDKLFSKDYKKNTGTAVNQKTLKSVFDLFNVDLKSLPDDTFVKGETKVNARGDKTILYRKNLPIKECGIFDTIEIVVFENSGAKNFILSTPDTKIIKIDNIKNLIDKMFLFYGKDSSHYGKFSSQDQEDIRSDWWSGRMWTDLKYEYPSLISMDENGYNLTIFTK